MTGAETLDVARYAIWTIVVVSSPLMIVGLVVGVVVSLFQALTQIQEQTLIFVPKILAIFVTLLLALPPVRWMGERGYRTVARRRHCRTLPLPTADQPGTNGLR